MNKRDALIVLIKDTSMFTDGQKMRLLSAISTLKDDQIEILGKFLAQAKVVAIQDAPEAISRLNELGKVLEEVQATQNPDQTTPNS